MRTHIAPVAALLIASACKTAPTAGPLGDGMGNTARIIAVDTAHPPRAATVQLDEPAHVAVLMVIPGHSSTLLYPRDATTDNRFAAGQVSIPLDVPELLVRRDSAVSRAPRDTTLRTRRRGPTRSTSSPGPVPMAARTFLLLVASPQPLEYQRLIDRTAGVSIPAIDAEALNAVAKAARSTLDDEPRTLSAYYQLVELTRRR